MAQLAGRLGTALTGNYGDELAANLLQLPEAMVEQRVVGDCMLGAHHGKFGVSGSVSTLLIGQLLNVDALARAHNITPTQGNEAQSLADLLAVYPDIITQLDGGFALTIYDKAAGTVRLVRDRHGLRQLLYTELPDGWVWSSEMRVVLAQLPARVVSHDAVAELAHFRWLVGETKLIAGVHQVLAGHCVTLRRGAAAKSECYWSFTTRPPVNGSKPEWTERIAVALNRSMAILAARYTHAAIPLSGGVDSSLLLAVAREHFSRVSAYALRVPNWENPELARAIQVATELGVPLQIVDVTDDVVQSLYPRLIQLMAEAPRQWNGLALLHLFDAIGRDASVDVVLSGQSADTLFGSSDVLRHVSFCRYRKAVEWLPASLLAAVASVVRRVPTPRMQLLAHILVTDRLRELVALDQIGYRHPVSTFLAGVADAPAPPGSAVAGSPLRSDHDQAVWYALTTESVNQCERMDRYSAEQRFAVVLPFLTEPMLEMASVFPHQLQFDRSTVKPVLKELASRYLSRPLMHAPKLGFPAPLVRWLQGPLQGYVHDFATRTAARPLYKAGAVTMAAAGDDKEMLWTMMGLEFVLRDLLDEPHALKC